MSGYTISEIVVWLFLAALLGFALGWLSRELVHRRRKTPVAPAVKVTPAVVEPEPEPDPDPEPGPDPEPEPEPDPLPGVDAGPHPGSALPVAGGGAPSPDFTVKVSRGSKIYHAPSSPAYARTTASLWFTTAEAAEAAGFRKPKNA